MCQTFCIGIERNVGTGRKGHLLCPFTFYMHVWVLLIYAQSFQHDMISQVGYHRQY